MQSYISVQELTSEISLHEVQDRFAELDFMFTPSEQVHNPIPNDTDTKPLSADQLEIRRIKLMELFAANRVDLTQEADGVLSVNNVVSISPPYSVNHCSGTNVIVLDRVKKLMCSIDL